MVEKVKGNIHLIEFKSINEFIDYITNMPTNNAFKNASLSSKETGFDRTEFTKTETFEDAVSLLKNGWSEKASELNNRIKADKSFSYETRRKTIKSVAGYQAIVPAYLMGMPNSMVSSMVVAQKSKIITINKMIGYNAMVSAETITAESIKALRIVQKLEAQGFRVNLNIVRDNRTWGCNDRYIVKVCVKKANERLNVSKVAFPLCHPSMLRRLMFRWQEVYPNMSRFFVGGYGSSPDVFETIEAFKKFGVNEIIIPNFLEKRVDDIHSIEDLIET